MDFTVCTLADIVLRQNLFTHG